MRCGFHWQSTQARKEERHRPHVGVNNSAGLAATMACKEGVYLEGKLLRTPKECWKTSTSVSSAHMLALRCKC